MTVLPPEPEQSPSEWRKDAFFRLLALHRLYHIHPHRADCDKATRS